MHTIIWAHCSTISCFSKIVASQVPIPWIALTQVCLLSPVRFPLSACTSSPTKSWCEPFGETAGSGWGSPHVLPLPGVVSLRPCGAGCCPLMPSNSCFVYLVQLSEWKDLSTVSQCTVAGIPAVLMWKCSTSSFHVIPTCSQVFHRGPVSWVEWSIKERLQVLVIKMCLFCV